MSSLKHLAELGLFDTRAPRYTSYPPANHFGAINAEVTTSWMQALPAQARVSIYVHIPYCRRLCWFCACRTQGTQTDRPLVPYMQAVRQELQIVSRHLPKDAQISHIHLGGGTPTLLSPEMIQDLGAMLRDLRPFSSDLEFGVEIDPTELDPERVQALAQIGMTRASIGVQDFDPKVQMSIGREQSHAQTRAAVDWLRDAGVKSLNVDLLYGLPYQTKTGIAQTVRQVIDLRPDRVALFGYAHVPWMAKRQVMIPEDQLPDAPERFALFETARRLFAWDGYVPIGIDHFARPEDSMAKAAAAGRLQRNFQGYTVDPADALIGMGASAISRYPQGYAQNHSGSSAYLAAIEAGQLASHRGHALSPEDLLRADLIDQIMCHFQADLSATAQRHNVEIGHVDDIIAPALDHFPEHVARDGTLLRVTRDAALVARMVCQRIDAYSQPKGRHSLAM